MTLSGSLPGGFFFFLELSNFEGPPAKPWVYLKEITKQLIALTNDNNVKELRFVVHTLRGVMGNLGIEEIFNLCTLIEERITTNKIAESVELISELDGLMKCFFRYVTEYTPSAVTKDAVSSSSENM